MIANFYVVPEAVWLIIWLLGTAVSVGMSASSEAKYDKLRKEDEAKANEANRLELERQERILADQKADQATYDAKYEAQRREDRYRANPMDGATRIRPQVNDRKGGSN